MSAEVRLYDNLFSKEDPNDVPEGQDFTANLNPNSLETVTDSQAGAIAKDRSSRASDISLSGWDISALIRIPSPERWYSIVRWH